MARVKNNSGLPMTKIEGRWEKSPFYCFRWILLPNCSVFLCSIIIFNKCDPFILFNSTDHTCYNFAMMDATKSGKDFNEWCSLWLIKVELHLHCWQNINCLHNLTVLIFYVCFVKVDYAPSLMARIVLERFLQEHEETPRELTFFLF